MREIFDTLQSVSKCVRGSLSCRVRPFFCFRLSSGGANFFSDVFRSYMSGNKPLTCGDVISGIALIELTLYNTSCIDKWLSTRPVFDAGLLPGIGAERSVK